MPSTGDMLGGYANGEPVIAMYANGLQVWPYDAPTPGEIAISSSVLANPAFPVVKSSDSRSFVDNAGTPFIGIGDTGWNAISRMSQAEFTDYVSDRRAQGYTALLLSILDINSRARAQTASGLTPFTGTNNSASLTSPQVTAGYDYWDHVEWCVDQCAANGMLAVLVPAWYGGWGDAWRGHMAATAADTSIGTSYGNFLASRLGDRTNVWWMLGGDNGPDTAGNNTTGVPSGLPKVDVTAATNALATAIKAGASVTQLMTYHTFRNDTAWTYFSGQSWYDIHAAYAAADTAARVVPEWNRATVKPVFMVEAYYADRAIFTSTPHLDRRQVRAQMWQSVLSGALMNAYGHEAVWRVDNATEGWAAGVADATAEDITVFSRVLSTYRGRTLHADIATPIISSGRGSGTSLAPGLLATNNTLGIVYVPGTSAVSVNLTLFSGAPDLAWVHPETGEVIQISSDTSGSVASVLVPVGWTDGILILEVR